MDKTPLSPSALFTRSSSLPRPLHPAIITFPPLSSFTVSPLSFCPFLFPPPPPLEMYHLPSFSSPILSPLVTCAAYSVHIRVTSAKNDFSFRSVIFATKWRVLLFRRRLSAKNFHTRRCVHARLITSFISTPRHVADSQIVRDRSPRHNPKVSSNPLLTRYNQILFFPSFLYHLFLIPLHFSFPRTGNALFPLTEIRWFSSSADRWRWGRAQISRQQEHIAPQTAIGGGRLTCHLFAHWRIWEGTRACKCVFASEYVFRRKE